MKDYQKCIAVASLSGGVFAMSVLNSDFVMMLDTYEIISVSDCILSFGLGAPDLSRIGILRLAMRMFPLYLFQFMFGCGMYQHFCVSGVYYFTRQPSRFKWYCREILHIFVQAALFSVILLCAGIMVIRIRTPLLMDNTAISLFILYLLLYTLWLFSMALVINCIAIKLGSNWGFLITGGGQILALSILLIFADKELYASGQRMEQAQFLINLNPVAHLVLGWHRGINFMMEKSIIRYQENTVFQVLDFPGISFYHSIVFLFCVAVILALIGNFMIQKQEMLINDLELGGE